LLVSTELRLITVFHCDRIQLRCGISGDMMDRRQMLLKQLDKSWHNFLDSYAGLSEPELLKPGVIGNWSARDIIAHVTTWEEEALKYLPVILQGGRTPRYSTKYGGINTFNALTTENKKDISLSEVFRQQDAIHGKLVEYVGKVPEEHLGGKSRFRRRLRADTYGHYSKHAAAIRRWRNI
jgi:hypothetical protein